MINSSSIGDEPCTVESLGLMLRFPSSRSLPLHVASQEHVEPIISLLWVEAIVGVYT